MGVHLLEGDDESILRAAVSDLVHRLVGDGDRSLMVEEFEGDDYELRSVVDAAQTMPFLTERRVVVARDLERFVADEIPPLTGYLADPLPSTELVLAASKVAKSVTEAVQGSGGTVVDTRPPFRQSDRAAWVTAQASAAGVRLAGPAAAAIAERLGEDIGRLDAVLSTLAATFGAGRALTPADVEPFVGEGGGVPQWDLTDALDAGDTTRALTMLGRMIGPGGRHPLQLMAILHGHYGRLARLDGVDARSESDAAKVLGIKPFPAKKALNQYRRLGGAGVRRAIDLLAAADLDLRGAKEIPDEIIMEVLVARLSRLRR